MAHNCGNGRYKCSKCAKTRQRATAGESGSAVVSNESSVVLMTSAVAAAVAISVTAGMGIGTGTGASLLEVVITGCAADDDDDASGMPKYKWADFAERRDEAATNAPSVPISPPPSGEANMTRCPLTACRSTNAGAAFDGSIGVNVEDVEAAGVAVVDTSNEAAEAATDGWGRCVSGRDPAGDGPRR